MINNECQRGAVRLFTDVFVFPVVFFRDFVELRALLSHSDIAAVIYGI